MDTEYTALCPTCGGLPDDHRCAFDFGLAQEGTFSGALMQEKFRKTVAEFDRQHAELYPLVINDEDLQVVTACASAHPELRGGQHVAVACHGVTVIHKPTGIAIRVDDERSQLKCKNEAMKRLRQVLETTSTLWIHWENL